MARAKGKTSIVDFLLVRTSRRFRTKFLLVTSIGVLVALGSSAGTALYNVTRLQKDATAEVQTGLTHANSEYLENYIDTTALRLNLLFEQTFSELRTTATIFQTLIDNPGAQEALGKTARDVPYFHDDFARDPNGNWVQNKPGEPSVISVWKYNLEKDGSFKPGVQKDVENNAIFDLFGPAIQKNGSPKLQLYYVGPRDRPIMRLTPYLEMAQTFDKLYPGHTDKNFWDFWYPGMYESWQDWLKNPTHRPVPGNDVTLTQPYIDAATGGHIISFFHPLWTKDRTDCAGGVAIDITLDQAVNLIRNVKIKSTGFAFLALSNGNVLAINREGENTLGLGTKVATGEGLSGLERRLGDSVYPEIASMALPETEAPEFTRVSLTKGPGQKPTPYTIVLRRLPAMNFHKNVFPIGKEYWVLGFVVSEDELLSTVASAERAIQSTTRNILIEQLVVVAVSLFAVLLGVMWVAKRVTANLVNLSDAAHRLMNKDYSVRVNIDAQDEVGRLGVTFNAMASDIEKYTNDLEGIVQERTRELESANAQIVALNKLLTAENLRLGAEIDVARRLQMMVLPKNDELTNLPNLDVSAYMRPADEVGGDYYDVLKLGDRIKVGIGDVTGHGLESGVLMLMVQSVARTLLDSGEYNPVRFLSLVNQVIYKNVQRIDTDKNMSLLFIDFEGDKAVLTGQHEEVLVVRSNGDIERIDTMALGFLVGLEPDISDFVSTQEIEFKQGDLIVVYTDGITEAESADGEQFGIDRLCASLAARRAKQAHVIRTGVIDDLMNFIGDARVHDDISIVVVKHD